MNNTDQIVSLRAKLAEIENGNNLEEASAKSEIAKNVFGKMTNTLGGEVASTARVGGKTWEQVPGVPGKYYNTSNKAEQITAAELKKLQTTSAAPAVATGAPGSASAVTTSLASKGAALKNIFKKNPKLWTALTAAAAVYGVGSALQGSKEEPVSTPGGSGSGSSGTPAHDGQGGMGNDLKLQIEALIKELTPSKDTEVQKELKRIVDKYNGTSGQGGMPAKDDQKPRIDPRTGLDLNRFK